jgi:O-antigen ligase
LTARASASVVATAAVVASVILAVAYDDGGYSLASRSTLGLLVWWTVLVGLLLGVWRPPRSAAAAVPAGLLAALAGWDLLSAAWSASAEGAVVEFDRTSLYLGIYVLVVLAARRDRLRAWIDGLVLAIVATACVALVSRLFPGSFPARGLPALLPSASTRLSFPLDYWNGLGIFAGIAVPLLVYSALAGGRTCRLLSVGALPALGSVLYLTSSRGAVAAAAAGTLVLIVGHPRRLAALGTAATGAVGAALAVAAVASRHAVVDGPLGTAAAQSQGREAAAALVVICVATALVFEWLRRVVPQLPAPHRGMRRLVVSVAVLLAAAAAVYEARSLGSFTRLPPTTGDTAGTVGGHLLSGSGSGRWQFWTAALDEFRSSPLHGGGPGSFEAWWTEHGSFRYFVKDAHSLLAQTLAELGIVGLLLLVTLLGSALTIGIRRLLKARAAERAALAALLGAVTVYLLGAAVDWMWELTVVTAVGLVVLALLAGPAGGSVEQAPVRAAGPAVATLAVAAALFAAAALLVLLGNAEVGRSQADAAAGRYGSAHSAAVAATRLEPWAATPYLQLALVEESRGEFTAARRAIDKAVSRDDRDWQLWLVKARIDDDLGRYASGALSRARSKALNPRSLGGVSG